MNINFKFCNYQNLYIFFLLFALIKIFFSTCNLYAKGFNINNVEISTKFEINFNRDYVLDEGFDLSFNKLINTILKSEDQKKINNTSLNEIKSMIETFSIKEEKFINQIYYLSLDVTFNKKQIFEFLEEKNVFPSLPIKNKIFLLPIIFDENKNEMFVFSDNFILNNINKNIQSDELLEYILPSDDLEDLKLIKDNINNIENYDLSKIIDKYFLDDYIIMLLFKNYNQLRVLSKINFNKKVFIDNKNFPDLNLTVIENQNKLVQKMKTTYEDQWKMINQINTSIKLPLNISIENNESLKISKFEKILTEQDLIYDFYIVKFDQKKIIYKIIFNGSPDVFFANMSNFGYQFEFRDQVWVLK
jgi:hypothetical protein